MTKHLIELDDETSEYIEKYGRFVSVENNSKIFPSNPLTTA